MIRAYYVTQLSSVGDGKHTRIRIERDKMSFDCIYFGATTCTLGISQGVAVDIVFEPHINEFRGNRSVQLHIIDIRLHESGGNQV